MVGAEHANERGVVECVQVASGCGGGCDQDVISGLGCGTRVAVAGGAVVLILLKPGAQDLQIVHGTCLQHAVTVVVGEVRW